MVVISTELSFFLKEPKELCFVNVHCAISNSWGNSDKPILKLYRDSDYWLPNTFTSIDL